MMNFEIFLYQNQLIGNYIFYTRHRLTSIMKKSMMDTESEHKYFLFNLAKIHSFFKSCLQQYYLTLVC